MKIDKVAFLRAFDRRADRDVDGGECAGAAEQIGAEQYGSENWDEDGWNKRDRCGRQRREKSMAEAILERWFTFEFRASQPPEVTRVRSAGRRNVGTWDVARPCETSTIEQSGCDSASTLVISGTHDPGAPPQDGRFAEHISGSRYVELNASHIANIEARERFTAELDEFLGA